jgi:hypothetical protein
MVRRIAMSQLSFWRPPQPILRREAVPKRFPGSARSLNSGVRPGNAASNECHLLHDRSHHLAQRWITYRRRLAIGDLFLGPYRILVTAQKK